MNLDAGLVGRDDVMEQVRSALASTSSTASVLLTGGAGIGKSAILSACARTVTDMTVVRLRPGPAESSLPYAGLADLLDGLGPEALTALPAPQRHALEVAVLRRAAPDDGQDLLALHLAVLDALRVACAGAPTLLVIDDLPWLDAGTAAALAFAARRRGSASWKTLATARTDDAAVLDSADQNVLAAPVDEVVLGPLAAPAVRELTRRLLAHDCPPSLATALSDACNGNPYLLQQLVRAFLRAQQPWNPAAGLPVPTQMAALLRSRLAIVPASLRELLVAAATNPRPDVTSLLQVTGASTEDLASLEPLVGVEGAVVRFEHPLVAQVVLHDARGAEVRDAHLRWSRVLEDPVQRTWHRALGTLGADAGLAAELERAASLARERAAVHMAAELLRLSAERSDSHAEIGRRLVESAETFAYAGDVGAADAAAVAALTHVPDGVLRARALSVRNDVGGQDIRNRIYLEEAVEHAADDPGLQAGLLTGLAVCTIVEGDRAAAARLLRRAVHTARRAPGPQLVLSLCFSADNDLTLGHDVQELVAEAVDLERRYGVDPFLNTLMTRAVMAILDDDPSTAVRLLRDACAVAERSLRPAAVGHARCRLVEGLLAAGMTMEAQKVAGTAVRLMEQTGAPAGGPDLVYFARAAVAAGDVDAATHALAVAEDRVRRDQDTVMGAHVLCARAQLHLALDAPDAADHYRRVRDHVQLRQHREPTRLNWHADAAEAFIRAGALAEAEAVLVDLYEQARTLVRRSQLAAWGRAQALLRTAQGSPDEALSHVDQAAELLSGLSLPQHVGRLELVRGQVLRRMRRRAGARDALTRAVDMLQPMPLWRRRAECLLIELDAAPGGSPLTATERRVAALVAQGSTNREVAQAMFMSVKTVEAHLSQVYRKLGIRSRSELARQHDAVTASTIRSLRTHG